jgi:MSHA biogenesis protein MshO
MLAAIKTLGECSNTRSDRRRQSGFTLMELIIVMIIMGVMSVGIAGFIKLSTQTYLNVTERDELLANARFAVERLNREVRNAVPNSMREKSDSITRCLEFVPIIASTVYSEIPVAPEDAVEILTVIPFQLVNGNNYFCNSCGDVVMVYPLNDSEVYQSHSEDTGKAFDIAKYEVSTIANTPAEIELNQEVTFTEDSPTNRAYIFNEPVSYCISGTRLTRYAGYAFQTEQDLPPFVGGRNSLMAEDVDFSSSSFTVFEASLQRNAVVQIKLNFTRDGEQVVFDNAIHITNIP